jgi:N-acetylglucosaminyldiphosphoundecaprenol N-acetyl-beta-D-mannosaminyltransferase
VSAPGGPGPTIERVNVLGLHVSAVSMSQAVTEVARWIDEREQHYVCVSGVHGVMESRRDPALQLIHNNSGLTTPDGMPLVWASHWAGAKDVEQVCGRDLMSALCELAVTRGWGSYFYGGGEGVPELLAARLSERFAGMAVVGHWSPPFRPLTDEEDEEVVRRINDANPDIVWVGLSTPKQERWMADHIGRLNAPVLIGVGAAFDMHAGLLPHAPPWMQRSGLEWLYRLWREPRRLWRRYLRNNPPFLMAIAKHPPKVC